MKTKQITEIEDEYHLYDMLSNECIEACSCSGDNSSAVDFWVDAIELNVPREKCIEIIRPIGGWSIKELNDKSDRELNELLLWVAAGCIS